MEDDDGFIEATTLYTGMPLVKLERYWVNPYDVICIEPFETMLTGAIDGSWVEPARSGSKVTLRERGNIMIDDLAPDVIADLLRGET